MEIKIDDLTGPEIYDLLDEHLHSMHSLSPPKSVHALDIEALRKSDITLWTAWEAGELLGCGALKQLNSTHAEIKSMRTATQHVRKGVAKFIVAHIIAVGQSRSYARLSLETGSEEAFEPARRLYSSFGFVECEPFADYLPDPLSTFMTLGL